MVARLDPDVSTTLVGNVEDIERYDERVADFQRAEKSMLDNTFSSRIVDPDGRGAQRGFTCLDTPLSILTSKNFTPFIHLNSGSHWRRRRQRAS